MRLMMTDESVCEPRTSRYVGRRMIRRGRRRRRGFIILFGTRPMISDDPTAPPVNAVCPRCGQRTSIVGKSVRSWFTLFFIPVFPVSGTRRFSQCTHCGAQFPVEAKQL